MAVNMADRISHLMDLQATQAARPLNSVLLRMENVSGIDDQIRIDTRGTSVDARLGLGNAQQAAAITDRLGELREALERRGLTAEGVRIQAPAALRAADGHESIRRHRTNRWNWPRCALHPTTSRKAILVNRPRAITQREALRTRFVAPHSAVVVRRHASPLATRAAGGSSMNTVASPITVGPAVREPGTPGAPPARKAQGALGKDDFLKLLVAQLKNQDPQSPANADQMAAQLAQFSSVEQLTNISKTLEAQGNSQAALLNEVAAGTAVGNIGRTVTATSDLIELMAAARKRLVVTGSGGPSQLNVFDARTGAADRHAQHGQPWQWHQRSRRRPGARRSAAWRLSRHGDVARREQPRRLDHCGARDS